MTQDQTARIFEGVSCSTTHMTAPPSSFAIHHLSFPLLLTLLFPLTALSQTRLDQIEATYQSNLRALHAPVLQDYLRQLELLKSQFIARNRAADARQVDTEIARVKNIVNTTGVLPYTELEAAPAPAAAGNVAKTATAPTPPLAPAKNDPTALPTLLAAEAFKGTDLNTKTGAIPLGSAEWRLYKLPAGTYDVLMIFSSETLALPELLTINIGGHEFTGVVPTDRATGSPETFRLLRLCQIKLDTEVSGTTLVLTASSQGKPVVWLKKLMFSTAKKPGDAK